MKILPVNKFLTGNTGDSEDSGIKKPPTQDIGGLREKGEQLCY